MLLRHIFSTGLLLICIFMTGCGSFFSGGSKSSGATLPPTPASAEEVKAQLNLATTYLMEGNYNSAMPELMKARDMDPRSADVENFFGLAYYGMKNYNQAIDSFKKALSFDSGRADVRNNLGLAYLGLQQYDLALAEFNACLASPTYQKKHLPLSNIGLAYMETSRYDDALRALTRATEENPNYAKAYQQIGRVQLIKGNTQAALAALEKAAQLDPADPETISLLEDARSRMSRR